MVCFQNAKSFNQLVVTDMNGMFENVLLIKIMEY